MTPRREPAKSGLDDAELEIMRQRLRNGGRPRVQVSGSQFPKGSTGTVTRIGDPDVDGPDFVGVRVKLGGVVDELGFAPGELSPAVAARPLKRAVVPATSIQLAPRPQPAPPSQPASQSPSQAAPAVARRRTPPGPAVTVTVSSAGSDWTVTARRGARVVLKSASLRPGVVTAIAALLEQASITEAVAAVNDSAREEAESRARKLRAELADVEAVLAAHRAPEGRTVKTPGSARNR